ncbi:MAG TPA: hypothetical protein VES91_01225 [Burkholderiaceae bacterium]|nr:hypothetical protein [Burkholderiaceae bacterium]
MTRSASRRVLTSAIMTIVLAQVAACERSEPNQPVQAPVAKAAPAGAPSAAQAETPASTNAAAADRPPIVDMSGNDTVTVGQQRSAARFADENFRLLTRDSVFGAKGGLDEMVEAQSESKLERVEFVVPLGTVARALQIEFGGETAEMPLAFKR